ncbi:MAG: PilZ domain-containing protein [Geminicoccaceae bacterium]
MRSDENPAPSDADRRLFNRYASGLDAEIVGDDETWVGQLVDLSIGGACVLVPVETSAALVPGLQVTLRSTAFGLDEGMPVVVRRRGTDRVHLAFAQDTESEHRLALFLLGSVEVPPRGDEGASEADSR